MLHHCRKKSRKVKTNSFLRMLLIMLLTQKIAKEQCKLIWCMHFFKIKLYVSVGENGGELVEAHTDCISIIHYSVNNLISSAA